VLSIIPGVIVGGVLVYLVAWLVMPAPPEGSADSSVSDEFLGV
jgi:phage shock protein PspC (stress-responsive transcriptional regulator)